MNEGQTSHQWSVISDLPSDLGISARPDLDNLLITWNEERNSLKDKAKLAKFNEQLATRWAIETGIIERLYTLDRGTIETLVDMDLDAIQTFSTAGRLSDNAVRIIEDQRAALDFVFQYVRDERELTISYIKELHQLL